MKKGGIYTGYVQYADFPNKAHVCVTLEEKGVLKEEIAIVKNAIPGQTVRFMVSKKKNGKCEGRLLEVLTQADTETNERCPHFGLCGGCVYQTVSYDEQLKMKESQVHRLLSSVISGDFGFEGIIGSPRIEEYRNKMEFSFGDEQKGGALALGLHKRNSMYDIVTVKNCRIVDEDYRKILQCVLESAAEEQLPFYHKMNHEGYLRYLLVRKAVKTGQILVDIVTTTQQQYSMEKLANKLEKLELMGNIVGFLHTFSDNIADTIVNERTELIFGQDYIYEELLGLQFKITPFSFFQTNSLGAEMLYAKVREYVGVNETDKAFDQAAPIIYDLYSGTGTIAQILAPAAKKVIGVEIVPEAVEAARINAKLNHLDNCEFIAGDVLKELENIHEKPDFIVVDPPRDGIHPKALKKIIDYGVDRMVYISCKPTSLIRDLAVFQENGYRVEKSCCVDMFPATVHVEVVCLLSKLRAKQNIEVELEMSEMDLTAAESKATYEEIKEYVLGHSGLKVSSLYIAQVKQQCGIIKRVNYNPPKSENSRQPKCLPEKEKAIRDALEHFQMI